MKIAILVHCFYPRYFYGTEAYALSLAKAFIGAGHDVTVITANFQGDPAQREAIEHRVWDGVPVISLDKNAWPHGSVRETYDQPVLGEVYAQILRALRPDVLHVCHLINHTVAVIEAAKALGIPVYATLTDFFGFCLTNKLEAADGALCAGPSASRANCIACHLKATASRPESGRLSRRLGHQPWRSLVAAGLAALARIVPGRKAGSLRPADIVQRPARLRSAMANYAAAIAPSAFLRDVYLRNAFPAPLHLSHFGVDIDRAPKPASLDPAHVRLGYVGQLASHKGVHILLEALRRSGARNVGLTIWGDETQDPSYSARLRSMTEGLDVRFAGTVEREALAALFAGIDALVIPSVWYENSPLILLQALATHTPVLVSDVQGLTEFIDPGRSGIAFPRGDAGALAQIIAALSAAPERLAEMSRQTEFSRTPADMADDVLALYARHGSP